MNLDNRVFDPEQEHDHALDRDTFDTLFQALSSANLVSLELLDSVDLAGTIGSWQLPPLLARLTRLERMRITCSAIPFDSPSWEHVPLQLKSLDLYQCGLPAVPGGLERLPTELTRLTQLTALQIDWTPLKGGWTQLPVQLRSLTLTHCHLRQIPLELTRLTELTALHLGFNQIDEGWKHLPTQLRFLDLRGCHLVQLPAELTRLVQLTSLCLYMNPRLRHDSIHPQLAGLLQLTCS